jgi:rfaE bifunctional protein nucleotidyltransferase chain/domain
VKIVAREQIREICARLREQGKRIVFTNGCFDILHPGHIHCLKLAAGEGDVLVVGVNDDESVRGLKGPDRPILPQDQRAELLSALFFVDYVVLFPEPTPLELVKAVLPDVLVKGGDYRKSEVVGRDIVEGRGGKLIIVDPLPGFSTTDMINRIMALGGKG